ncbi:MAG: MerC domain-containing protein [Verrucomicrobiota bacterium]
MSALTQSFPRWFDSDRVGIVLSVLCAIHCAITPILLLLAPAFGGVWSHPASHWLVALIIIPIAAVSVYHGFSEHRRRWVPICGGFGILLILVGAFLPYLEGKPLLPATADPVTESAADDEPFFFVAGQDLDQIEAEYSVDEEPFYFVAGQDIDEVAADCVDSCCPSLISDENGNTKLNIPPASIVTTLGGLVLILTHAGNLCCCSVCRRGRFCDTNHQ